MKPTIKQTLLLAVVLCTAASAHAEKLALGNARQVLMPENYVYLIPVSASLDGYSTMRAVFHGQSDFIIGVEGEVILRDDQPTIVVHTPRHFGNHDVAVQVEYQGKNDIRTYSLGAPDNAAANGATLAAITAAGCNNQWVVRGTLVNNINRILTTCEHRLGRWPFTATDGTLTDFLIERSVALPEPGQLPQLLTFLKSQYGLASKIFGDVVDFSEITP